MLRLALMIALFLAILVGPHLWVRHVFARYRIERPDFPGTGGELARHLLDRFNLSHVTVGVTPVGDHYDPMEKAVRLTRENYEGKTLTAVTVAAHEVGHALQDHAGYRPLAERTRLVRLAQRAEHVGAFMMLGIPVLAAATRTPAAGVLMLVAALATMGIGALVHLVTLPVEWDASFHRALPILERGGYLSRHDLQGARRILTAAALTYVAGSLASLLNLWRWIALIRRA